MDRTKTLLAALLGLTLLATALAAPVTFSPTGDAHGSAAAGSGTGDADAADDCSYVPVPVPIPGCVAGVAASGTGDADSCAASYAGFACFGGAASGAGDARACSASGYGGLPCAGAAVSGLGDAAACDRAQQSSLTPSCLAAAASGTGDSDACSSSPEVYTEIPSCVGFAGSGAGDANACAEAGDSDWPIWPSCIGVAASGTGDADACGNEQAITTEDDRCVGVAVSGCDVAESACTRRANASAPTDVATGPDADGDGVPASLTLRFTRVEADANAGALTPSPHPASDVVVPLDPNDADPDVPLVRVVRVRAPGAPAFGPDADGDGVPATAEVGAMDIAFDRTTQNVTTTPADVPLARVTLDANDQDPQTPVVSVVRVGVAAEPQLGPDADGDGVPSQVRLSGSTLTLDRRNATGARIEPDPAQTRTIALDANDGDPDVPLAQTVRVRAPGAPTSGPDEDGDGFPSTLEIGATNVAFDRGTGNVTTEPDDAPFTRVRIDPNDADPNVPVTSTVTVQHPSDVVQGPDADGDGVPSSATVQFSSTTLDRRDPAHPTTVREPRLDTTVRLDPNDGDADVPMQRVVRAPLITGATPGADADGDGLPATMRLERSDLVVDRGDPAPEIVRRPEQDLTLAVDPDDHDADQQDVAGVSVEGDAEGEVVAVSAFGDATACSDSLTCLAASGAGTSRGYLAASALGDAYGCDLDFLCTGVSGAGDAQANDVAVSVLGDAQSRYVALSGAGDASGEVPLSAAGTCEADDCFGADGSGHWVGATPAGDASGIVAVTPEGAASGGLVGVSATGPAKGGLVAVSASGDAQSGLLAASGTGDAAAPVGVGG